MANYLCVFSAPDEHINFIKKYPEVLFNYVEGEPPVFDPPKKPGFLLRLIGAKQPEAEEPKIPIDWPVKEVEMYGPEVNHRNVDLFHIFLNGSTEHVTGAGTFYQTWLTTKHDTAIDLTNVNENFAFYSDDIPELLELVKKIDRDRIQQACSLWTGSSQGKWEPDEDDCDLLMEEFSDFIQGLETAVKDNNGIIWISS